MRMYLFSLLLGLAFPALADSETSVATEDKPKEPIEVFAKQVTEDDIFDPFAFGGTIQPKHSFQVSSEVAGTVTAIHSNVGDLVRKGSILLTIQPFGAGLGFQKHQIRSPFTGTLSLLEVRVGEQVQVSQEVLRIDDTNHLNAEFWAGVKDLSWIENGMEAVLTFGQGENSVEIPTFVESIARRPDPKTGGYRVTATIQCEQERYQALCRKELIIGRYAKVIFRRNNRRGVVVALKSLHSQRRKVLTVSKKQEAQWIDVELGQFVGDKVEIKKGLEPGMTLVTSYAKRPNEGDVIKVVPEESSVVSKGDSTDNIKKQ